MRLLFIITLLVTASSLAIAAEAPTQPAVTPAPVVAVPDFVPFTVSADDYKQLQTWLGEQPTKFGLPMLQFLNMLETRAKAGAEAAKAAAKEAPAPVPK